MKELGLEVISLLGKHRYFYFLGNKKQKREMMFDLKKKYKILLYLKGESKRYEIKENPLKRRIFF